MASALPSSWHSVSLHRVILRAAFFISLLLVTPASNGSLAGAAPRERQGGRTPGRGAADRRKRGCGASLPVVRRDARTETGERWCKCRTGAGQLRLTRGFDDACVGDALPGTQITRRLASELTGRDTSAGA